MPIWAPALTLAGLTPADVGSSIHQVFPPILDASFLLHLGPLGDVIPIPFPLVQNVASVGDLFLAAGLAFFLFASVVRFYPEGDEPASGTGGARYPVTVGRTGLSPALAGVAALERPLVLGGRGPGLSSPTVTAIPPRPEVVELLRRHPYVRLALNGSFSALWAGQFISVFGDRIHQIALAAMVLLTTGSEVLAALSFVAASLPNLFLSPIAGTFVDRWDRKEVLIVSDILRAAVVLLIPIAAVVNIVLVYPLIFVVTAISIFFRPARVAIMPQIVENDELVTANSAMWIGETIGDVIAYPLAGLFVASLMNALPLAFWLDAVTYIASAVLLTTIAIRPRGKDEKDEEGEAPGFVNEMKAGWRFLRNETTLLANTVQASVAQFTIGILTTLTVIYCYEVYQNESIGYLGVWGFMEAGIGAGNLLGGFVIGLVGTRLAKGRMIIDRLRRIRLADLPARDLEPRGDRGRARVRVGHREHGVRHPEPGHVPGAHAGRPARSRSQLPVRPRLRLDDRGDGARQRDGRGRAGDVHHRGVRSPQPGDRCGGLVRPRDPERVTSAVVHGAPWSGPLGTLAPACRRPDR